jgi:hypothetical protein
MWAQIIEELYTITQETLITVGTEKEALLIQDWGKEMKRDMEIIENPADPIYDLWACRVHPA